MPRSSQDGLEWETRVAGPVARWTRDVSAAAVASVCRAQLRLAPEDACAVAYYTAGATSKLYAVDCGAAGAFFLRVLLPVYPGVKTRAEVATMRWVRQNTAVPVLRVLGYDDSRDNAIGFEWILMERVPGTPVRRRWRAMTMEQKAAFTRQVAALQVALAGDGGGGGGGGRDGQRAHRFAGVGTLCTQKGDDGDDDGEARLGPLVLDSFFAGERRRLDGPRGPFRCGYDWLSAELGILVMDKTAVLGASADEDDREDAETVLLSACRLLPLLSRVFPPAVDGPEATALFHHDLGLDNILVDDSSGAIAAVLSWECVSALPLWMQSQVPRFLDTPERPDEPLRDGYADESPEDAAEADPSDPDCLDSEGKNSLYFVHRMEYEATQLRSVHAAQMQELWPGWTAQDDGDPRHEFLRAILSCDTLWTAKARRWAEALERGSPVRFVDA